MWLFAADEKAEHTFVGWLDTNDEDAGEMGVWDDGLYFDERTGEALDPNLLRTTEGEEVAFLKRIDLYVETDVAECWAKTGKVPISTKWVKVNKGTAEAPEVRCRLVARDFKPKGEKDRGDLFAAMPPLEAKKALFQQAVNEHARNRACGREGIQLMLIDVKKARLNGVVGEDEHAYIELPGEVGKSGKCGRLNGGSTACDKLQVHGKWITPPS